jgi:hypothetical protein
MRPVVAVAGRLDGQIGVAVLAGVGHEPHACPEVADLQCAREHFLELGQVNVRVDVDAPKLHDVEDRRAEDGDGFPALRLSDFGAHGVLSSQGFTFRPRR